MIPKIHLITQSHRMNIRLFNNEVVPIEKNATPIPRGFLEDSPPVRMYIQNLN